MSRRDDVMALKTMDVPAFLERGDVAAFVGPNFDKFKAKWLADAAKTPDPTKMAMRYHWNLLAVVFWPAWFGYRKMHKILKILTPVYAALVGGVEYYSIAHCHEISPSAFFGGNLLVGLMALNNYFMHVVSFFQRHRSVDAAMLNKTIAKEGGVSVVSAVLWGVGFVAALAAVVMAIDTVMAEQLRVCRDMNSSFGAWY